MKKRVYLPTIAELVDRMAICQLKAVFIPENKSEYMKEVELIKQDINICILEKNITVNIAELLHATQVNMLANRVIWENESEARKGGSNQDYLLKYTHSINGIRNNAKNIISQMLGERKDLKLDCLAAEIIKQHGYDWDIYNQGVKK